MRCVLRQAEIQIGGSGTVESDPISNICLKVVTAYPELAVNRREKIPGSDQLHQEIEEELTTPDIA